MEQKDKRKVEKAKIRAKVVELYEKGISVDDIVKEVGLKSRKQVVGILVYEGKYKKSGSQREKIINYLSDKLKISKEEFKGIKTSFLEKLYNYFQS